MPKYRKKPVVIEAMRFTGGFSFDDMLVEWGRPFSAVASYDGVFAHIDTLEGEMNVSVGDWVIRGIKGEFYPCKADIFEATYEKVEE